MRLTSYAMSMRMMDRYGAASSSEIVVNSHMQGKPCFDANALFYHDLRDEIEKLRGA